MQRNHKRESSRLVRHSGTYAMEIPRAS